MTTRPTLAVALGFAGALALSACGSSHDTAAGSSPSTSSATAYAPAIDPASFTTTITNTYFPLAPGTVFVSDGEEDGEKQHDEMTVTSDTKIVDGVTCVVVHDVLYVGGKVREDTYDWYAQASDGAVWYFGEDTKELRDDGSVSSTEGSWESGKRGAQPGVIMPARPTVGTSYRQEYLKGEAEDMAEVVARDRTITTPTGTYTNVVVTRETTALEPDLIEEKRFAPGIGFVSSDVVKGGNESFTLTRVDHH